MSMLVEKSVGHTNHSSAECHYCGYEAHSHAVSGRRCPKCGGSSWSIQAAPDASCLRTRMHDDPSAPTGVTQVRFELLAPSATTQAYIFIGAHGGKRKMISLRRLRRDKWELILPLPPQTYHYRFYVDDGERLLYFDPATSTTSAQHGRDATLCIEEPSPVAA